MAVVPGPIVADHETDRHIDRVVICSELEKRL
jgi:hypothetical protein